MNFRTLLTTSIVVVLIVATGFAAVWTQPHWYPLLFPNRVVAKTEEGPHHHEGEENVLTLSAQARKNIGLVLKPVELGSYTSSVRIPASVTPQPGKTSIKVTTPIAGVVEKISAFPGQLIQPEQELFALHLHYHELHEIQTNLFKTKQELLINDKETDRLKQLGPGIVAQKELLQLEYEKKRLETALSALQASLTLHGFSKEQVQQVLDKGKFISDWTIRAPKVQTSNGGATLVSTAHGHDSPALTGAPQLEMSELLVRLGDHIESGKPLATLSNFQHLQVEARVFQQEIPLIEEAIQKDRTVQVEILDLASKNWSKLDKPLSVLYLDPHVDAASQTAGVFLDLPNQAQEYTKNGKTYRLWKYRPGQKVYLTIPHKTYDKVFVLPREAVAQDGLDTFVFAEQGDAVVRTPVHVIYQDQHTAVIANDGSIFPRDVIAHNAADQLLRALKTKAEAGEGHGHDHHHH